MRYVLIIVICVTFFSCRKPATTSNSDDRTINFPLVRERVISFPQKEKLWIFILAGQSNMAGRGLVEPQDTISNKRIISLGEDKQWYYAKEPLHFYEPERTGLDCGLSFARQLLKYVPEDVTIGLIPCAVGGSAVSQWNSDENYRGVNLLTNFTERAEASKGKGTIKGILWHQGESDAHGDKIPKYAGEVENLFSTFRSITENNSLPILIGELGSFRVPEADQLKCDSINAIIHKGAATDKYRFVVSTGDLSHKGDNLHFDSKSQREMGVRFANTYARDILRSSKSR